MDIFGTMKPIYFISLVGLFSIFPCITGYAGYVRLMDGQVPSEGRVEVYTLYTSFRIWGSVCDDHWGLDEAEAVCKELGYSGADLALVASAYGPGTGPIWLDDVQCRGGEASLFECNHNTIGTHDCSHQEDASVMCTARGSLRLINGTSSHDGMLQIMGNSSSVWGSVCGDTWTAAAGEVACRQLGFSGYLNSSLRDSSNSANSGHDDSDTQVFLSGFRCHGNERRLEMCLDAGWSTVNTCNETQDVILQCDSTDVRLVDGSVPYEGRVEVFYGATWGTVCDDYWGISDASVVCRQLGYELGAKEAPQNSHFGSADGPILLDDLNCNGLESSLFSCQNSGFANDNCDHRTDAGAVCLRKDKQIRLVGGFTSYEGVVQVWYYGAWHTVCDDADWGREEREVVCRQLGYEVDDDNRTPVAVINAVIGDTLINNYKCTGEEELLHYECPWSFTPIRECLPETVAQAWCSKPKDLDIRLQNREYAGQGLLELYHSGTWGTVNALNEQQAEVVCRQLGYESVMEIYDEAVFGIGDGPIWDMETITCDGNEDNLRECASAGDGVGVDYLDHKRDISMMCRPYESIGTIKPRLVGYDNASSNGRLEIYLGDGAWGSVCSSEGWGQTEAQVVCRQLNYDSGMNAKILDPSEFPNSYGPTAFSNVDCDADDNSLRECQYGAWGTRDCLHDQDVGIDCNYEPIGAGPGGSGMPVWEIILIAAMGFSMLLILIGLAIYQRGRHHRPVSSPTHIASRDDLGYIHDPAFDMTEPPPNYRPSTPPPTESPPSYESLVMPPYKPNENAVAPQVDEDNRRGHDQNDQRTTHQNNAMPRGM